MACMQIFLAPRSNETSYKNFISTIEGGVDYSIVEPYLDPEGKRLLNKGNKLFAWGCKEGKRTSWEKMRPGDLVLFYKGKEYKESEGKFIYAGRLIYKQNSKDLGLSLWPPKTGQAPWSLVYFLTKLIPIFIPLSHIVNYSGGYSKNFIVQGFMPYSDEGTKNILSKYNSFEKFLSKYARGDMKTSDLEEKDSIKAHAEAELLLLKIGKMLGYETYSPDKSYKAYGEELANSITLKNIPTRFIGSTLAPIISEIDVIWFKDEVPKFAFEVEHSTKLGSGFQRLCQLIPLSTKLFIMSPTKNSYLFEKYINTDPYYKYRDAFRFRDYTQLESFFKSVSELTTLNNTFLR